MKIIIFEADYEDIEGWLQSESESESGSGSESETEDECQTLIPNTYVVICPPMIFNDVPYGIFENSVWEALIIKLDGMRITPLDIKNVNCIADTCATQVHPDKITVDYDKHWDCYCKTRRVCGCGCDPLHDGW